MSAFEKYADFQRRTGHALPIVKCPSYHECGDYADRVRPGSKPGKVQVACGYHAQRMETSELIEREAHRLAVENLSALDHAE